MHQTGSQPAKTITGKVTDVSGEPIQALSVIIKGTTKGIITDADGNYTLSNVPENATLVFSFLGMLSPGDSGCRKNNY